MWEYNYKDEVDIGELVGQTVIAVWVDEHKEQIFFIADKRGETILGTYNRPGKTNLYAMSHAQNCCENVTVEDIDNDLNKMIGATIVSAEEVSEPIEDDEYGHKTWTFYKLATDKGDYFTIRWLGESNGYYSEDAQFFKLA